MEPVRDIGSTLRQARDRRALPLDRCAESTRIRSKYLIALEENRFDSLPEPAYARGFLKTYADYLGLDPGRLLDLYDEQAGGDQDMAQAGAIQLEAREPPLQGSDGAPVETRGRGVPLALLLLGAAVAVAIVWFIGTQIV